MLNDKITGTVEDSRELVNSNYITIPDTDEIPYPAEDLKKLKKCLEYRGFLRTMSKSVQVSEVTIRGYKDAKKGQKGQVTAIVAYVNNFLKATA